MLRFIAPGLLALGLSGAAHIAQAQTLLVFGDSLSDNGRAWQHSLSQGAAAVPPSPPYWQGRFSNGPVAVEVMAQKLGLTLDDRAWGGATSGTDNILDSYFGSFGNFEGTGVQSQVQDYLQASPVIAADTQVVLWAGANDLFVSRSVATTDQALANIQGLSQQLIDAGAKQLLLPLLPDLGLMPFVASSGAAQAFHDASVRLNEGLRAVADSLSSQHPGVFVRTFDTPGVVQGLMAGGLDATSACVNGGFWGVDAVCTNPDQHLFWDSTHFSAAVHQQLGLAMASAVPEPGASLLWGVGVLALWVWRVQRRGAGEVRPRPI